MIIFLTGHRKSGTSLLHRLFDNHPDVDVYPTDFTLFYNYFPYYTSNYDNKKFLIEKILSVINQTINEFYLSQNLIHRYNIKLLNIQLKKNLRNINLKSKKEVFKTILHHWANLKGEKLKRIIVVKETSQSIYFDEYLKIFNNMKMVNIVRDPRDNYASIKSGQKKYYRKFNIDYLQNFASTLFRSRQDLLSTFYNSNHNKFTFITYEDLVSKPRKVMKQLCYFLGIKFHNILLNPSLGKYKYYGNNFNHKINGISNKNKDNWKKRITIEEKNIIEFYLSDVMKIFNYRSSKNLKKIKKDFSKFNDEINSRYFFSDIYNTNSRR
jgi:hypothetical protein